MTTVVQGADGVKSLEGRTLGPSSWQAMELDRIRLFADATGDHQWIHVDAERAARESPFGAPIAHGYLTLSVLPLFFFELLEVQGAKLTVNYGLDKLRFPAPVKAGSRIRGTFAITGVEEVSGNGVQLKTTATVEIEGGTKPACVAEALYRYYF